MKKFNEEMERHEHFNRNLAIFFFVAIDYLKWRLSRVKNPFSKIIYRTAKAECESLMTLLPEITSEDTDGINLNWARLTENLEHEMEIVQNYRRREAWEDSVKKFYDIIYDHLNILLYEIQEAETEYDVIKPEEIEPVMCN